MRYFELFAGAGGLSLGLDRAGMVCLGHAEIEPHARAVLRRHWPDLPLYGDVRWLQGQANGGVDLVSGGSPCQDLSVAGKRAGLAGSRSGLFFEQVRVWRETQAPYLLWENVVGALSSNKGKDFGRILSVIVGAPVVVPRRKRRGIRAPWPKSGVVRGPAGVAAWRVFDLQHFGPPQRRRRVFVLGARTGACDPAAVLLESEGVCRHPAPRRDAGEGAPGSARGSAAAAGDVVGTLKASDGGADVDAVREGHVLAYDTTQVTSPLNYSNPRAGDPCHPLAAGMHAPLVVPAILASGQANAEVGVGVSPTLTQPHEAPIAFHHTQDPISGAVTPRHGVTADGMGVLTIMGEGVTHALTHEGHDASEDGTGRGTPVVLAFQDSQSETRIGEAFGTLDANYGPRRRVGVLPAGVPRRLMPIECERLMGWPDGHTEEGVREDGARYRLSDAARYKLCGNGVGSPCAEWIGRRLMAVVRGELAPPIVPSEVEVAITTTRRARPGRETRLFTLGQVDLFLVA